MHFCRLSSLPAPVRVCRHVLRLCVFVRAGLFPHKVIGGRNFVSRRSVTHIYVDLVAKGSLTGDAARDLPPRLAPCPPPAIRPTRIDWKARKEDMAQCSRRKAPQEPQQDGCFKHRLCHEHFFCTPIECSAQLVFSDTLEVVDAHLADAVLESPRAMRKANAPVRTYTSMHAPDPLPFPAYLSFTINKLSRSFSEGANCGPQLCTHFCRLACSLAMLCVFGIFRAASSL